MSERREQPIAFTGDMVRAILDRRKTETRRPIGRIGYARGDLLWVKETFTVVRGRVVYRASNPDALVKWRPSLFLSRDLARIELATLDVRLERLHDCTTEGAIAEGFADLPHLREAWDAIYGEHPGLGWHTNPMVCVITFALERVRKLVKVRG